MKILTCTQQKEADEYTIAHNSILSINLMEKLPRCLPMPFASDGINRTASLYSPDREITAVMQ